MKRNCKRGISILLSVCLVLGIFASAGLNLVRAADAEPTVETVVSEKNLIANGTFGEAKDVTNYADKTMPECWNGVNLKTSTMAIQVTDAYALDGTKSVHIAGVNEKTFNLSLDYTFTAEDLAAGTVVVSAWIRGIVNVKTVRMGVEFRGSDKITSIREDGVAYVYAIPVGVYDEWTEFSIDIPVPAGAAWARIKPIELTAGADADIYVDCVSAKIGGKELFVNTSFETMPEGAEYTVEKDVLFTSFYSWTAGAVTNGSATAVVDPADAKNGVLKIEDISDTNYPTAYTGGFAVEAGASYTFTLQYKVAEGSEELSGTAYLRGNASSSAGVPLTTGKMTEATTEWKTLEVKDIEIPADGSVETFYAMFTTPKTSVGNIYIDEVTLIKVCDEHTWGEATVSGAGTCESALVSTKTCFKCGATETATTTYPHTWANGVCSVCGAACEHNAPEGYCTICGLELPAQIVENELFLKGALDSGRETVISYPVNENWQIAPYTFGGLYRADGISMKVTNEWASDGDWSFYFEDSNQDAAVSINYTIAIEPSDVEREIYMSADIKDAQGSMSMYVRAYEDGVAVNCENAYGNEVFSLGPGQFENTGTGTISATGTIPAGVDRLDLKISTPKTDDAPRDPENPGTEVFYETVKAYIDNLKVTVDGGENLVPNSSFEILPVGVEAVEVAATPAIDYAYANVAKGKEKDGWYGVGDLKAELVEAGCVEEFAWEDNATNNGVLHINDTADDAGTAVYYYLYGLKASTSYTLKLDAKRTTGNGLVTISELDGNTVLNGQLNVKNDSYVTSTDWETYEIKFATDDRDFNRVKIAFTTSSSVITEVWYDNFSLTVDCDHKWENPVVSEADCINASTRTVTCACGAIGETELNPCTGEHTLVGATCTIPSYCTVPGCGYIAAPALGHDYSNGDGVCARCQHVCGHTYVDEEGNSTNSVCFLCGKVCPHTDSEEAVISEATCTDTGVKTIHCPDCGYFATEEIAALGHDFIDNICQVCGVCCTHEFGETVSTTSPTYTAMGEKVGICVVCGEQVVETIPAKFYGTSVNLGNTLDMYFGFYTGLVDEGGKVVFVREFADGTTETTEAPITAFKKNNSVYDITYTGLAAKEMCDTIHISVYNSEGTLVGEHSDSIRSYILCQLREKEYGQEFRTLCIDLLNYGAAAQIEFGYNADDLANKDLTTEELAEGTQFVDAYADKQTVDGDATSYYGTSYILETQISMAMAVRADRIGADCYALVSYIDHTGTEKSNIRVEGKKNYSVYEFFLNEIVVADGRCLLTIEFYKADGTKILTVQDSMESYTARNAADYPLAEKMLAFSDSAYNYLHRNDQ